MSEAGQSQHSTTFTASMDGQAHTGSGNINNYSVIILGIRGILELPKLLPGISGLATNEQTEQVTRVVAGFEAALQALVNCQKRVDELKRVHNMLHEVINTLLAVDRLIRNFVLPQGGSNDPKEGLSDIIGSMQKKIVNEKNWKQAQRNWKWMVLPKIDNLRDFAFKEMKFLEDPPLIFNEAMTIMKGPEWIKTLLDKQDNVEKSLAEQSETIDDLLDEILGDCHDHLRRIDRRLLDAINELNGLFDELLRSTTDGPIKS